MNELHAILDAWRDSASERQPGVLCTVVQVKGSAYRRPGARMLIFPDGRRIGSISGGCLEGDVCRKGWWLTGDGRPALRVYDTMSEDDAVWEFGLGCNGVVHVLLERLESDNVQEAMRFLSRLRETNSEAVISTVIRTVENSVVQAGDRLYVTSGEMVSGPLAGSTIEDALLRHSEEVFRERKSRTVQVEKASVLVEWVGPPVPLVVFGAGHDALPLAAMAKELGWNVTIADGRPAYARAERFPAADRVILLAADDDLSGLQIDRESVVVLLTHNYPQDERLLREILPLRPRYLGILGPKKRAERLFEDLGEDLQQHRTVHAPVGLDIGADEPASIALSILAEIQAALAGRMGGKLRGRSGPIHQREDDRSENERAFRPMNVCAA